MKEITVYNPQKGRCETLYVEFTEENTTWFSYRTSGSISRLTDWDGGLIIQTANPGSCPLYVYDVSRAEIGCSRKKVRELMRLHDYN